MPLGTAYWPGAVGCVSCSYTVSHDAQPGAAVLEIPEQDVSNIQPYGTLTITDGNNTVNLNRCMVRDIGFSQSPTAGRTITLRILDRRWMWRKGTISGNWNQQDPQPDPSSYPPGEYVFAGGPYTPGTYRTADLLMADCLVAMNEITDPLISPAPVVAVPVQWDNEVPAQALAALAARLGYRLVYQPNADRVLLAPAGTGAVLSNALPIMQAHGSLALPPRPNAIALVGGPTLYHDFLALEPVGMEADGSIVPIVQLSYTPAGGWGKSGPPYFGPCRATSVLTEADAEALAKAHVFRTFRVKMVDVRRELAAPAPTPVVGAVNTGPNVGGYGLVGDRAQLVLGSRIYDATRSITGQPNSAPAFCVGSVYMPPGPFCIPCGITTSGGNSNPTSGTHLPYRFTVDAARGLVQFERCMLIRTPPPAPGMPGGRAADPVLFIYTSFTIRSLVGQIPVGYTRAGVTDSLVDLGCPPEVLRHPELVRIVRTVRADKDFSIATTSDNVTDLDPVADYYLQAANAKYNVDAAADLTYAGIWPIDPDGAIQQVTWSVGGGAPATTRASRNTEHAQYLPSFPERRRTEDLRRFISKQELADAKDNAPYGADPARQDDVFNPFA